MTTNFVTSKTLRAELEALSKITSEDVLYTEFMHSSIGTYLIVQKHRRAGENVRDAVMAALKECG